MVDNNIKVGYCVVIKKWIPSGNEDRMTLAKTTNLLREKNDGKNVYSCCSFNWLKQQMLLDENQRVTLRMINKEDGNKNLGEVSIIILEETREPCVRYIAENLKKSPGKGKRQRTRATKKNTPLLKPVTKSTRFTDVSSSEKKKQTLEQRKGTMAANLAAKKKQQNLIATQLQFDTSSTSPSPSIEKKKSNTPDPASQSDDEIDNYKENTPMKDKPKTSITNIPIGREKKCVKAKPKIVDIKVIKNEQKYRGVEQMRNPQEKLGTPLAKTEAQKNNEKATAVVSKIAAEHGPHDKLCEAEKEATTRVGNKRSMKQITDAIRKKYGMSDDSSEDEAKASSGTSSPSSLLFNEEPSTRIDTKMKSTQWQQQTTTESFEIDDQQKQKGTILKGNKCKAISPSMEEHNLEENSNRSFSFEKKIGTTPVSRNPPMELKKQKASLYGRKRSISPSPNTDQNNDRTIRFKSSTEIPADYANGSESTERESTAIARSKDKSDIESYDSNKWKALYEENKALKRLLKEREDEAHQMGDEDGSVEKKKDEMHALNEKLDKILTYVQQRPEGTAETMKKIALVGEDGIERACVKGVIMEYDQAYSILNSSTNRKRLNGAVNAMWPRDEQVKLYMSKRRMPTNTGCRVITNEEVIKLLEIVEFFESMKPLAREKQDGIQNKHREWISKHLTSTREAYHPNRKERTAQRQKIGRERRKARKEKGKTNTKKNQTTTKENDDDIMTNILTLLNPMVYNELNRHEKINKTENLTLQDIAEQIGLSVKVVEEIFSEDAFICPEDSNHWYPVEFDYEMHQLIRQLTYAKRHQVQFEKNMRKMDIKLLLDNSNNDANLVKYLVSKYTVRVEQSETEKNAEDTENVNDEFYRFSENSIRNTFLVKIMNDFYNRAAIESTADKHVAPVRVKDVLGEMRRLPLCEDLGSEWLTTRLKKNGYLDKSEEKEDILVNATIKLSRSMISKRCWQYIVRKNFKEIYG